MAAAREIGAQVATMPLMLNASVAEHALTLMLCCIRKAIPGHKSVTEAAYLDLGSEPIVTSQWDMKTNWTGIEGISELFGTSVGIVDLGDIEMDIATLCRAFNIKIFYYQRTPHLKEEEKAFDATYLPLEKLLAEVDFVVLIIPHTPKTEGIIGTKELAGMKPTATLINVGRGGLIDEDALAEALRGGVIAMAGLDVYRREPLPESNPLRPLPNVVPSPHTRGGSNRSWGGGCAGRSGKYSEVLPGRNTNRRNLLMRPPPGVAMGQGSHRNTWSRDLRGTQRIRKLRGSEPPPGSPVGEELKSVTY